MQELPLNSRRGFTLLELLVVLALIGMMLTLAPPLFSNAFKGAEAKSAVRQLASALRQTRAAAVSTQRETTLIVDVGARYFHGDDGRRSRSLPEHAAVTLTTADSERISEHAGAIRFFPDGSSTGGRILLQSDNQLFTIEIDWLTGRITVDS